MANKTVQTIISGKRKNYLLNHNISLYRTDKLKCTTNFYAKLDENLTFKLSLLSLIALSCLIFCKLTFRCSKILLENIKHNYFFHCMDMRIFLHKAACLQTNSLFQNFSLQLAVNEGHFM